ncbi:MAG: GAF domain-containing protein [Sphingomonadales bacterium]|nr:GAF domain-containing protein [Sphingomonadales bacterium]
MGPGNSTIDIDLPNPPELEVRRLTWALGAYARSARALVRSRSLSQMAESVCRAIAAHQEYVIAAIAMAGPAPDKEIRFIASAGSAREYLDGLVLTWRDDLPAGLGPTGRGIRSGEPWVMDDAMNDPVFDTWRDRARPYGIRSSTTVPFGRAGERTLGAVVVYASVPYAFSQREVQIFQELGEEIAFAISVIEDQQKLEEARRAQAAAEAEARARQAEVARIARALTVGEFASSIAHEITQPLAAVITNVETAMRYLAPAVDKVEAAREALTRALRDADRAHAVIRETRRRLARDDGDFVRCDVNGALRAALGFVAGELDASGVAVTTALADGLPAVLASEVQLQQVLINLIANAREALQDLRGRERRLTIASQAEADGGVGVSVTDNGMGMSDEVRERLFDHFFTTKRTGMGMGLAISRSIIEAHGGKLWSEPGLPFGTRFRISLPAAPEGDDG